MALGFFRAHDRSFIQVYLSNCVEEVQRSVTILNLGLQVKRLLPNRHRPCQLILNLLHDSLLLTVLQGFVIFVLVREAEEYSGDRFVTTSVQYFLSLDLVAVQAGQVNLNEVVVDVVLLLLNRVDSMRLDITWHLQRNHTCDVIDIDDRLVLQHLVIYIGFTFFIFFLFVFAIIAWTFLTLITLAWLIRFLLFN